jgi:hypothetical protein
VGKRDAGILITVTKKMFLVFLMGFRNSYAAHAKYLQILCFFERWRVFTPAILLFPLVSISNNGSYSSCNRTLSIFLLHPELLLGDRKEQYIHLIGN